MVATPVKVLLFLAGGTGAAAGAAYVAGAFDWITGEPAAVVGAAAPNAPKDEAAPKEDRLPTDAATPPAADASQPPAAKPEDKPADVAAASPPAEATPPAAGENTPPAADAAENLPSPEPTKPEDKPADVAALTPPADGNPPAAENPPVAEPAQGDPAAVNESIVPSFDIVRVEGDGSIVIAGRAAPGAYVEVLTGSVAIAGAAATPEGDFAAVPNDPLKPGDYEVKLRATAPGNIVSLSDETALISIPEKPDGQILAMVEKPGEASEIITKPLPVDQPARPAKPEEVAAADAATPEPKPAEAATPPADPAKPAEAAAPPAEPEKPADVAAADPSATPEPKPAEAAPPADAANPPADPEEPAEIAAADSVQPVEEAKPAEAAAADPKTEGAAPAPAKPAEPARVAVEAVEIEGRKIFVAGAAEAGRPVRVYANEILLGDTRGSPEGRFLVEAVRDLPVGNYIIRADLLSDDGSVVARAAVPFEREPGETIAAIAPPAAAPAPEPKDQAAVPTPEPKPAEMAAVPVPEARPETPDPAPKPAEVAAVPTPEPKPAEAEAPTPEPKPAEAAAPTPEPKPEEAKPADVAAAPAEAGNAAAPTPEPETAAAGPKPAEAPAPMPEPKPEQPAEVAAAPAEAGSAATPPDAGEPANPPAAEAAAAEPPAAGESVLPKLETEIAANPPEVVSPKLQASGSGVIIRRGDTLWRISKRVYGRGMRYSTIYLANQDQIEDPDRIWPGQVFKVPEKTDKGEAADMSAVGEQATSVE